MVLFHMTSIGTTDINSLPSSNGDYKSLDVQNVVIDSGSTPSVDINNVVSDIQKASSSGLLKLPTRDIPTTQNHITMDASTEPNHIPPADKEDYINQYSMNDLHMNVENKISNKDTCDYIIDEFGFSIMITIMYFLFQSDRTKGYIYRIIPFLHGNDTNPTTHGYMVISVIFGLSIYMITYLLNHFKS